MNSNLTSRVRAIGRAGFTWLVLLLVAGPIAALLYKGGRSPFELVGHLLRTVVPTQLALGVAVGLGAALVAALLAIPGLACALFDFPGRALLHRLLLIPLLLPAWYLALMLRETTGKVGLVPLIVCLGVASAPLYQLACTTSLQSIPRAYLEQLRSLGRSRPIDLVRVLVPLAIPAAAFAALLVFLQAWADVASARNMAVSTLAAGMLDQWTAREDSQVGALLAILTSTVSMIAPLVVLAVARRLPWQDDARLAGATIPRWRLGGVWATAPWIGSVPILGMGVALPWAVAGKWALARLDRVPLTTLGLDALHSFALSLSGALVALMLALVILRTLAFAPRSVGSKGVVICVFVAFAMPSTALAVAVLWATAAVPAPVSGWISATALPLVFAFGLRYSAVFLAAGQSALWRQASSHVVQLRLQGRTDLSSFVALLRPFLSRPLLTSAAYVFLESLKEQSLLLILQPFNFPTLAGRVFQFVQTQRTQDCAVWMLCMALLGVFPLFELARMGERPSSPPP